MNVAAGNTSDMHKSASGKDTVPIHSRGYIRSPLITKYYLSIN